LEGVDFCGTDVSEVFGVEEEHHILFTEVLVEREIVDDVAAVDDCCFAEMRSLAAYENCHDGVGLMG
jgi:hypothetical protein